MRQLGLLLVIVGIAACVVHLMEWDVKLLEWTNTWGEEVAWAIRGGFILLGLILLKAGKPSAPKK
jgi:hypothetical protein